MTAHRAPRDLQAAYAIIEAVLHGQQDGRVYTILATLLSASPGQRLARLAEHADAPGSCCRMKPEHRTTLAALLAARDVALDAAVTQELPGVVAEAERITTQTGDGA